MAIIQARMGSSRLPGKVLKPVAGVPLIDRVIRAAKKVRGIDSVVVATTETETDDELAAHLLQHQIGIYRGDEIDVLGRFAGAARESGADTVVRVTADDPVKDPRVTELVLETFAGAGGTYDYVSNTNPPTWPEGQDVEVFSAEALFRAAEQAEEPYDREHVTPFMYKNPDVFSCHNVTQHPDQSSIRLTLDTSEDLAFFESLLDRTDPDPPSLPDILAVLAAHPEISAINASAPRSAAYR